VRFVGSVAKKVKKPFIRWVYTERDRGLRRWYKYNKLKSCSAVAFCMNDFSLFYLDHSFASAAKPRSRSV